MQRHVPRKHDIRGGDDCSLAGIHYTFSHCPPPPSSFYIRLLGPIPKEKTSEVHPNSAHQLFKALFDLTHLTVRIRIDSPPSWRRYRPANEGRRREVVPPAPPAIPAPGRGPLGGGSSLIITLLSVVMSALAMTA